MRKFLLIVIMMCHLLIPSAYAQTKPGELPDDSLRRELKQAKEDTNKVILLITIGGSLINISQYDSSEKYCQGALALSKKLNFRKGEGNAYNLLGNLYNNRGDLPNALSSYSAA